MSELNFELSAGNAIRLLTGGKYCPDDIVVNAVGGGGGLKYDMGTFTLDADKQKAVAVPHNLGEVPYFVMVWSDHWANLTADTPNEYTTPTNVGFIYARGLAGMLMRLTSASVHDKPIQVSIQMPANDYRVNVANGTASSYGVTTYPDEHNIYLGRAANNVWWRSGVVYNYFVAPAWWNAYD